jgi:hypothetical protein
MDDTDFFKKEQPRFAWLFFFGLHITAIANQTNHNKSFKKFIGSGLSVKRCKIGGASCGLSFDIDGVHSISPLFLASSSLGMIAIAVAIFRKPNRS